MHKQQKGQTQLYLLLSSFVSSPQQADIDAYCFVLASALNAGQNPALEDRKGRNALFVLCDRMAQIPLGEFCYLCLFPSLCVAGSFTGVGTIAV
jgi:hypothetical protein